MNDSNEILNYSIEGNGTNLVLIHGFLESNSMWKSLHLEDRFTCIKIELPGHGTSTLENNENTIQFMAECVRKTLESIQIFDFDMLCHSLGGYVALEYAYNYGLEGKLILLHSNFWEDDDQKKIDRQRVANIVLKNKNMFLNEALPALFVEPKKHFTEINNLLNEAKKMTAKSIADTSLSMQNRNNHTRTLKKFTSQIHIIQGELDRLVPLVKMRKMMCDLKNSIVVLPKTGHMGQHENPKLVRSAIDNFLGVKNEHF